jgi:hypothetical protein
MSKRKKEIRKRKKLEEDTRKDEGLLATGSIEDPGTDPDPVSSEPEPEDLRPPESPVDDSQIVTARSPAPVKKKSMRKKEVADQHVGSAGAPDSWIGQNKENFLLGLLVLYVILLGLGTVGELFEIEWILNLPLFK